MEREHITDSITRNKAIEISGEDMKNLKRGKNLYEGHPNSDIHLYSINLIHFVLLYLLIIGQKKHQISQQLNSLFYKHQYFGIIKQLNSQMLSSANAPLSQVHILQQHHFKHKRRLQRIVQSKPSQKFTFTSNFRQMLQTKRFNHQKWKLFQQKKQKQSVLDENIKMYNKLILISLEEGPYSQQKQRERERQSSQKYNSHLVEYGEQESIEKSRRKSQNTERIQSRIRTVSLHHHNNQILNMRRSKMIDDENPKIAQRIMQRTGHLSHTKDMEQFRRTRQILNRIQKFHQVKRVIKNLEDRSSHRSEIKNRSRTLPAGPKTSIPKIQRRNFMTLCQESPEVQKKTENLREKKNRERMNTTVQIRYKTQDSNNNISRKKNVPQKKMDQNVINEEEVNKRFSQI